MLVHYEIVLPFSVDEVHRGHAYMVARASLDDSTRSEGMEPFLDVPLDPGADGQERHWTFKSIPSWILALLPYPATLLYETALWSRTTMQTEYASPYFGDKLHFTIDTVVLPGRGGIPNPFSLGQEDLDQVRRLQCDIRDTKLLRFQFERVPFASLAKRLLRQGLHKNFTLYCAKLYCWADEWHPMSDAEVDEYVVTAHQALTAQWQAHYEKHGKTAPTVPDEVLVRSDAVGCHLEGWEEREGDREEAAGVGRENSSLGDMSQEE
ncbi:phosphatidylinositol transfer protein [Kipferlia bialata]|uniref:Phosphatidylinositol transfer protein n=1 Tax=Kipferlia bialata TaxID=797122 RepID=A0A9K3CZA0_9EUKA|nr:phosphatidylinositol transfer protein [Kipferlia bialata]|eukprot:g5930.t1